MSDKKLLPCPFCGGEAYLFETHEKQFAIMHMNDECPIDSQNCVGDWVYDTKEEAIQSWNTRKPMQKIVERLEELQKENFEKFEGYKTEEEACLYLCHSNAYANAIDIVKKEGM